LPFAKAYFVFVLKIKVVNAFLKILVEI